MKWTLRESTRFVELNGTWDGVQYQHTAEQIAKQIGCTMASVQSMRRKANRLNRLGVLNTGSTFALFLLVPEPVVLRSGLSRIRAYAQRDVVRVRRFVRRARFTGKAHLVGPYKRNIAITSAEARA